MGHITRLEEESRDSEYKSIKNEATRLVSQSTALMARLQDLHAAGSTDDKTDVLALQGQFNTNMIAAVTI